MSRELYSFLKKRMLKFESQYVFSVHLYTLLQEKTKHLKCYSMAKKCEIYLNETYIEIL